MEPDQLIESCLQSRITFPFDNPLAIHFSVFMCFWTVFFIEFWKRETSRLQYEWDAMNFDKHESKVHMRPQYESKAHEIFEKKAKRKGDLKKVIYFKEPFNKLIFF